MRREITQRELRNESVEIVRQLDAGHSFVVTRRGVPVGELVPLPRHRFVTAEGAVTMFRGAPEIGADRFRRDIDQHVDQDLTPSVDGWLERTRRRPSEISRADIVGTLDEIRGSWPDGGA